MHHTKSISTSLISMSEANLDKTADRFGFRFDPLLKPIILNRFGQRIWKRDDLADAHSVIGHAVNMRV